ncbi:unnamed protein product, partial [Brassica napus]
ITSSHHSRPRPPALFTTHLSLVFVLFWALLVLGYCLISSYLIECTIVVDIYY